MSIRIENVKDHIGGIVHVDKAHICDDDCGRMMHRTTIMGTERLGRPLAELETV